MPLLAPCSPLLPRGPVPLGSPAFFLSAASLVALIAAHAHPACAPCSSLRYPCLAAPCPPPCLAISPLLTSYPLSLCGSCLYFSVRPHCHCRAFTRVCHPCVLPLPLSVVPTLFPGVVSHPHPALSVVLLLSPILVLCLCSPTLSPSVTPWVHVEEGGGFTRGLDCDPARGRVRRWIVGIRRP